MSRIPKRTRFRKQFKGKVKTTKVIDKSFYSKYGLMAVQAGRVSASQIEACRSTIMHQLKRKGRLAINIFPDIPVTAKAKEVRMGRGKGNVESWICRVQKGKLLFQLGGAISTELARMAFHLASAKLPIKTKWIQN